MQLMINWTLKKLTKTTMGQEVEWSKIPLLFFPSSKRKNYIFTLGLAYQK